MQRPDNLIFEHQGVLYDILLARLGRLGRGSGSSKLPRHWHHAFILSHTRHRHLIAHHRPAHCCILWRDGIALNNRHINLCQSPVVNQVPILLGTLLHCQVPPLREPLTIDRFSIINADPLYLTDLQPTIRASRQSKYF